MRRASPEWLVRSVVTVVVPIVLAGTSGVARADEKDLVLDLGTTSLELRQVPRGTFMMGSPASDAAHEKDEEPHHQVTIARELWVGKTPVTRGQFAKFVADTHYVTEAEKGQAGGAGWDGKELKQKKEYTWKNPGFTQAEDHPVVLVTFGDATAFASWASRKTGKRVRLPTEAEWEYAARAGTTGPWYSGAGEGETAGIGWFKTNAGWTTHPVGQKKANAWGLFDMSGNTFEWCRDHYAAYRDGAAIDPEQTSPGEGAEKRVLRGGSWMRDVKRARSASRKGAGPGTRNAENGFRVVVIGEDAIAPAVGGAGPGPDFLPVAPLGPNGAPIGSASASPAGSAGGLLPDGGAEPLKGELATSGEPFSWSLLVLSPLAAAAAVVAWMMLRPKRGVAVAGAPSRAPAPAPVRAPAPSRVGPPTPAIASPPVTPPIPRPTSTARIPATPSVIVEDMPLELPAAPSPSQTQKLAPVAAPPSQTQKLAPVAPSETNKLPVIEPETQKLPDAPSEPLPAAEAAPAPAAFEGPPSPPAPLAKPKPSDPDVEEIEAEEITSGPPPVPVGPPSSKAPPPVPPSSKSIPPVPPSSKSIPPVPPSSKSIPPVPPSSKSIPPAPPSSSKSIPPAPQSSRSVPPPVPSSKAPPPPPSSKSIPPTPPSSSKVVDEEKKPEEKKPAVEAEEKKPEPPKEEPKAAEEKKAEEPPKEEPKADVEEKKPELPKEEPKVEEEKKAEGPPKEEPKADVEEKKPEPPKEEPKAEEGKKAEEPPKEEPKADVEEKKPEPPKKEEEAKAEGEKKPEPPKEEEAKAAEEKKAEEPPKEEPKADVGGEKKPEPPKDEPKGEEKKPDEPPRDDRKAEDEKKPEDEKKLEDEKKPEEA